MEPYELEAWISKRSEKVTQHIPGEMPEPCPVPYMGVDDVWDQKIDDSLRAVRR